VSRVLNAALIKWLRSREVARMVKSLEIKSYKLLERKWNIYSKRENLKWE
jgi:hypothetical protein